MTDADVDTLRSALMKYKPARVRCYQGDELSRDVPVGNNKKRWADVLDVVGRLRWTSLELCDKSGGVLHVHTSASERDAQRDVQDLGDGPGAAQLRLMLAAQKEALANSERKESAAMQACVQMMGTMSEALQGFVQIQRQSLEAQRLQYEALLGAQAARAAAAPAQAEDDEDLESMKVLKQIAPQLVQMFAARMLAPTPAPTPPPPKPTVVKEKAA